MKPKSNPFLRRIAAGSLLAIAFAGSSAFAQTTQVWVAGGTGTLDDASKYASTVAPVNGDTVTSDGTGSVISFDNTGTVTSLGVLSLNVTSGATVFNQTSGTLGLGTLNFGGAGGSRNPTYNHSGGILNITGNFTWGNGSNANFNVTGGTTNHTATGFFSLGVAGGARAHVNVSSGTFNSSSENIRLGGSTSNGIGYLDLSGTGIFNANAATGAFYLANNNGSGHITMAGTSQLNIPNMTFVIGQFGSGVASLTMDGGTLTVPEVVLGGLNAGSSVAATVTLNGGTVVTNNIRKGSSNSNTLSLNGGTVKASADTATFFTGLAPVLGTDGLVFDSNTHDVTIAPAITGTGGLTKTGDGFLTLSGANNYSGDTAVEEGTLTVGQATLDDASTVSVATGALLDLTHGGQDEVTEIVLGGVSTTTPGTYGSTSSSAIFQDDDFFSGNGVLRIGPVSPGVDLTWTGLEDDYWETNGTENFTDGVDPLAFHYNDNVTFDDSSTVTTVNLYEMLYPGVVTFDGTQDYVLQSASSPCGIAGPASVVINNTASVSLGGPDSAFTGPITVNAGVLKALDNKSFGANSGITIADGAQVDLNGKIPGSIYTYTLNGSGAGGTGAIVNSTATDLFSGGGVKHLILDGDSTIGSDGGRFDIGGGGGSITGNGNILTKVGNCQMAFRGTMDEGSDSIAIVVAGGFIWAEGSATAFGGSSGSLTIQSGAAVGTFGSNLTIDTPVSVESGGTLRSGAFGTASAITGTWTNSIDLAGEVTLDAMGGPLALSGSISGTANVTKTGGNEVIVADPTYTGNTTVAAGTLSLNAPSLDDEGDVVVASEAVLNLNYSGTDTVDTLVLGGTPAIPGTWGSSDSSATNQDDTFFQGEGVLNVLNTAVVPSGFDVWADENITQPENASLKGRTDDPDGDSFTNLEEFLFGTDPEANNGTLTDLTTSGSDLIVRWIERDTDATYELQESTTLESPWPASGVTPVEAGDQTGVPTGYTRMEATIPIDSARKYVRVNGVEN